MMMSASNFPFTLTLIVIVIRGGNMLQVTVNSLLLTLTFTAKVMELITRNDYGMCFGFAFVN